MDSGGYFYNWWQWLIFTGLVILFIIGLCKLILEFPGILDWRFLKQRLEDDVENPVSDSKRRGVSLYRPVIRISREVVRKISQKMVQSNRVRKKGVCVMMDMQHPVHIMEEKRLIKKVSNCPPRSGDT